MGRRRWPFRRALRGLRVVGTRPPEDWFYGLAHQYAALYAQSFRDLGAEVLAVPVEPFVAQDDAAVRDVVDEIRRFRPDLAMGLHDAGYAVYCRASRTPEQAPTNVFADWLELPTILLWDHALLQFAPILLGKLPDHPDDSMSGCLSLLREELSHPLYVHVARDSGHRETAHALGVVPRERVLLEPSFAHPHVNDGHSRRSSRHADVAFFGHMRPLALESRPARHHAALVELRESVLRGKIDRLATPVLQDVVAAVDELPPHVRASMRLAPDESFYWSVLGSEMAVAQTWLRRELLEGLGREVAFYGDYGGREPGGDVEWRPARFRFGPELGSAFAGAAVTVDLVNPGFLHGFGTKVMNCFAAGGFMLLDRKQDFVELLGELGEAVSFSSLADLRAKLDHYLSEERERRAIAGALRERINADHSLPGLLRRVTDAALGART
jgi:Glycosyl transferases group 1